MEQPNCSTLVCNLSRTDIHLKLFRSGAMMVTTEETQESTKFTRSVSATTAISQSGRKDCHPSINNLGLLT